MRADHVSGIRIQLRLKEHRAQEIGAAGQWHVRRNDDVAAGDILAVHDHRERILYYLADFRHLAYEGSAAVDGERESADVVKGMKKGLIGIRHGRLARHRPGADVARRKSKLLGDEGLAAKKGGVVGVAEERGA